MHASPTPPDHDPLRAAWHEALQQLPAETPSPATRERILAHARATRGKPAANDARWRITALGSVMAMSVAGLLAWHLLHGPVEPTRGDAAHVAAPSAKPAEGAGVPPRTDAGAASRRSSPARDEAHPGAFDRPAASAARERPAAAAPARRPMDAPVAALAAGSASAALAGAAARGDLDAMRRAIAGGAVLDEQDDAGRTPLVAAVLAGRAGAVRLLLEAGADPGRPDRAGTTPLQQAQRQGDEAVAQLLIDAGARN